ncbi:VTT domain-containing protein [Anaeromicropila herbilytica]|uniref:Membrane protein DedA, SNARE-associated domain n=1 Tax=Anaeromicropila herbilytica TaxID=2785025 RepID=A0A7R7ICT4_9FIRM|nr:VTT domain-containing protein [Anaeromicropila herbilytica]BCN31083.1 hypothetical protein bsdtb5_23780 [Anaeromicropila herbilytica]
MSFITDLFNHYGYVVLYIALMLELIALPTPGETLMIYCGFLVYDGKLNWIFSIITAAAGVITGVTISYFIGKLMDKKFIERHGSGSHSKKFEKVSKWFSRYGNGLLVVSYFIPGIRHVAGYFAGITKISFKKFAINSYIGAFIWTTMFISLGKVLGPSWEQFHSSLKIYFIIGGIIVGVIIAVFYLYKNYKEEIREYVKLRLEYGLKIFHSLGKVRLVVICLAVTLIGLVVLTAGLIQDFLANEFGKFDTIVYYLTTRIFNQKWTIGFRFIRYLTSYPMLILLTVLIIIWIRVKAKNRILEVRFLISVVLGGEILEEVLRTLFHRLGPMGIGILENTKYTFPSEQTFMISVAYGYAVFLIIRHDKKGWLRNMMIPIFLLICLLSGIGPVFFNIQYPSDVVAGYVFGGVWLSINIILLEVFRILPEIEDEEKV